MKVKELSWTKGFCRNPKCGRFVQHFGTDVPCPQCGLELPNRDAKGLTTFGVDYSVGWILGFFTCAKWSPSRLIERALWKFKIKPRSGEELTVLSFSFLILTFYIVLSLFPMGLNTAIGILFLFFFVYRLFEIVAIRTRIVLYDKRLFSWKHASYTRSLLLLVVNLIEVTIIYACIYIIAFTSKGIQFDQSIDGFLFSLSTFLSNEASFIQSPGGRALHILTLSQHIVSFLLIGVGLSALVNMMGSGKEVHSQ